MWKRGFDNDAYIKKQSAHIRERIEEFGGKLYLEFGGKLFDDFHASRVLPGFQPDSKLQMLKSLSDDAEIVIVISATDIVKNKVRNDLGITYDSDVLRLIDAFRASGLYVGSVVISRYNEQPSADAFRKKLIELGMRVYLHYDIEGYPINISHIVSPEGFGKNEYIETTRPLVVVTAPGPGSGKMCTCLSQLYHEYTRGISAGYAKFETFPIWNIPLKHPVNLAYEAATADLDDVNMIDPYHLEAYGETTVNYNRDIEVFPVLRAMFEKILGKSPYNSPTDMGVNMAGTCIIDDDAVQKASKAEIIRRYFSVMCDRKLGRGTDGAVNKVELLMKQVGVTPDERAVVGAALAKSEQTGGEPAIAIELPDGRIITGRNTKLLGPSASALLNAVKALGDIDDSIHLIPPEVIEPIQTLKTEILGNHNPRLHSDEVLIALTVAASQNADAALATSKLEALRKCEAHSTVILSQVDLDVYRKLGINLTCEPRRQTKNLYYR